MQNLKIGVIGATGQIGSHLINALSNRENISVCAFSRDITRAKNLLPDSIEIRQLDSLSPNSNIFNEINRIFWLVPDDQFREAEWMDIVKQSSLEKIVLLSSIHPEIFNLKSSEHFIKKTGIPYIILRPNTFMQNFNNFNHKSIVENNAFYYPASAGKTSFIDIRDIATAAEQCLVSENHQNKIYTLTGEQSLTYYNAAEILSEAYGKTIRYIDTYERPDLDSENSSNEIWNHFFAGVRNNLFSEITPDLTSLLGHPARTFTQYANDYWKNRTATI